MSTDLPDTPATGADMDLNSAIGREDTEIYPPQDTMDPTMMLQHFRDQIGQDLKHFGDAIPESLRDVIREEIRGAKALGTEPAPRPPPRSVQETNRRVAELQEQIENLNARNYSLEENKSGQEREIKALRETLAQKNRETKKLHQIIIESSQTDQGPPDDDVIRDFNSLSNSIMRIVKKHYTYQGKAESKKLKWKHYNSYNPENKELFLRALIADRLYQHLFSSEGGHAVFGLDEKTNDIMADFEGKLKKSGKVPEADITNWRVCTASVAHSFDHPGMLKWPREVARIIWEEIGCVHTTNRTHDIDDAKQLMEEICESAHSLSFLFRRTATTYAWAQEFLPSAMTPSEMETVGSLSEGRPIAQRKVSRIVFGAVLKGAGSGSPLGSDHILLRKADVLVGGD